MKDLTKTMHPRQPVENFKALFIPKAKLSIKTKETPKVRQLVFTCFKKIRTRFKEMPFN
jgi:hypothetical protein